MQINVDCSTLGVFTYPETLMDNIEQHYLLDTGRPYFEMGEFISSTIYCNITGYEVLSQVPDKREPATSYL